MTITLYAQPYDITATGFYFDTYEDYQTKSKALRNEYGDPVEEFEIQFIDGESLDYELSRAIGLNQSNIEAFFDLADALDAHDKTKLILATGECGYPFTADIDPDDLDIDIYHLDSMRELAIEFVDEGLFGDIPDHLQHYIDYDAMARDLSMDYAQTTIAGQRLIYRCG